MYRHVYGTKGNERHGVHLVNRGKLDQKLTKYFYYFKIEQEAKLDYVEIPHWAGLGGVCYLPPDLSKTEDETAKTKEVTQTKKSSTATI